MFFSQLELNLFENVWLVVCGKAFALRDNNVRAPHKTNFIESNKLRGKTNKIICNVYEISEISFREMLALIFD